MSWRELQEIDFENFSVEQFSDLCYKLEPFAVKGMTLDSKLLWSNTKSIAELGGDEQAEISFYTKSCIGTRDPTASVVTDVSVANGMSMLTDLPEAAEAAYVKWGLPSSIAEAIPFASLFMRSQQSTADLPLLIAPGRSYSWMYAGTKGSGSKTHIDILNTSAWLYLVTGSKKWLVAKGHDWSTLTNNGKTTPDLFSIHHNNETVDGIEIYEYTQKPGTAIFIPPKCLHSVVNEEQSVSLTQNFVHPTTMSYWEASIREMMNITDASTTEEVVAESGNLSG